MLINTGAEVALIVIATINVLALVALALAGFVIKGQIGRVMDMIRPVMDEVRPIMQDAHRMADTVTGMVGDVSAHVHEIATTSEHTVKDLTHRVETTGSIIQDTLSQPVIKFAAAAAGVGRALAMLRENGDHSDPRDLGEKELTTNGREK